MGDLSKAWRIALAEIARFAWMAGAFSLLGRGVPLMSWWAVLSVWLVGATVTHIWLYRGLAGPKPRLTDFGLYFQDSGIAMVILLWPMFVGFIFGPEFARSCVERLVGIRWRAGERHFD